MDKKIHPIFKLVFGSNKNQYNDINEKQNKIKIEKDMDERNGLWNDKYHEEFEFKRYIKTFLFHHENILDNEKMILIKQKEDIH